MTANAEATATATAKAEAKASAKEFTTETQRTRRILGEEAIRGGGMMAKAEAVVKGDSRSLTR